MSDILDLIDHAIGDWSVGPDAMRCKPPVEPRPNQIDRPNWGAVAEAARAMGVCGQEFAARLAIAMTSAVDLSNLLRRAGDVPSEPEPR